jgi:putative transposase
MFPITEFTKCLQGTMTSANLRILLALFQSFLCIRYETTTRGLSRYCEYSLRQIFRFLSAQHKWLEIRILLFKTFIYRQNAHYIVAIDEVVEGKSGAASFGIDRFYSSCQQKTIKGICFFALSLINIHTKSSYLLNILQVIYSPEEKERIAAKKEKIKEGKQRTKEGKNLPKGRPKKLVKNEKIVITQENENSTGRHSAASFRVFKDLFISSLKLLKNSNLGIKITHLVADCAYGSLDYLKIALDNSCFLISKLKSIAALYEPAQAEIGKRGRPKLYAKRIDLHDIDQKYLKKTEQKDGNTHKYYQFEALSKALVGVKLNVVVLIVINEKGAINTNVWFSNDLSINYETLLQYYSLRFQIEFHFRDAKQHFGLSDFKNYKKQNLTNFVNLSFTMCMVSKIILDRHRIKTKNSKASILDLKIIYNAQFSAKNIIKYLGINDCNNFYSNMIAKYMPTEIINRL